MSDLAAALQIAIKVHAGQRDKQGEPYLLHVLRVIEAVYDEAKIVAALHDVLEDGPSATVGRGFLMLDDDEFQAVKLLTREGDSYAFYISRMCNGDDRARRLAREVKLADLRDNLGRIPERPTGQGPEEYTWDEEWASLKARYTKALATLEGAA